MSKELKKAIIMTAITAVIARVVYGLCFCTSELAAFNTLPGLDMATLLEFSEWDKNTARSTPMFVLHRFLLFFCYLAAGKSHNYLLIYLVQSLFGVAGAIFTVYAAWHFSKSFRASLGAGIIYSVYGPFMLYESVALQESVLTHTLVIGFAIWLVFLAKNSLSAGIVSGLILGLNSSGRPATAFLAAVMALYPMWVRRKDKMSVENFSFLISLAAVWLTASLFNWHFRNSFNAFFNVVPHLAEVHNAPSSAAAEPAGVFITYWKIFSGAVKNVPFLFGMREIPENLDYDVIRQMLPLLSLGPLLVMPFAVSGIISFALLKRKELTACYIAVFCLILPLAARVPIGRYRLLLMPFFIIFGALFIEEMIKNRSKRSGLAAIFIGVAGANLFFASPLVRPNPAAHHTFALAAMKLKSDYMPHLQRAWETSGYTYKPSGLMLIIEYIKKHDFRHAEEIIKQNKSKTPEFFYYHALIKTAQNQLKEAESLLKKIEAPEKLGALYPKYQQLTAFLQHSVPDKSR